MIKYRIEYFAFILFPSFDISELECRCVDMDMDADMNVDMDMDDVNRKLLPDIIKISSLYRLPNDGNWWQR